MSIITILGVVLLVALFDVGLAIVIAREGRGEGKKKGGEGQENKPQ